MQAAQSLRYAIALLALGITAATAQTPTAAVPSTPAPIGPDPAVTTATYGDWVLRCQATNPAASTGPKRLCEVVQTMQMQGQQEPVAQVAFGRAQGAGDLHLVIALPVNVSFPSNVGVGLIDKDAHPFMLEWKRCIPGACFADAVTSAELITRWRATTTPGHVMFKDASARDIVLPLSFRGLAPALDALNKGP